MPKSNIYLEITAQNTFTDPMEVFGDFTVEFSNDFSSTVCHIQRKLASESSSAWRDLTDELGNVLTWSGNAILNLKENTQGVEYRAGVKTGNYTDEAHVRISQ